MNDPLNMLRLGLRPFSFGLSAPEAISDPSCMTRAWGQVLSQHGSAGLTVDTPSIMANITGFRQKGRVDGFRELKYVCQGIGIVDQHGWSIIADDRLRNRVFELVERLPETHRHFRCFQALLLSFWYFPLNDKQTSTDAKAGWVELRKWLRAAHKRIAQSSEFKPPWFGALTKHQVLLSDQPCEGFGKALLSGDAGPLNEAKNSLSISDSSWVLEEAVVAQIRAGCSLSNERFNASLSKFLDIGMGRSGVPLGERLRTRSVSLLVSRYAQCQHRPEHPALRDAAVAAIGNPWLQRTNWDTWVVDAHGKPDPDAREMVNRWLNRRLVTDFFELLSDGGAGDGRRVNYWLRYATVIEQMWFALGSDTRKRRDEHFKEFRVRAQGLMLSLDGTTADNNAFVMRVGRYLIVEFGAKGNAMYVFEWHALDDSLRSVLDHCNVFPAIHIDKLKPKNHSDRLIHRDSGGEEWEHKFDAYLIPRLNYRPGEPLRQVGVRSVRANAFSQEEWNYFVRSHHLIVEDNRSKKGALWVFGVKQSIPVIAKLEGWGFTRREPRGWFKE